MTVRCARNSYSQFFVNTQETIDRIKAGLAELEKGNVIVE